MKNLSLALVLFIILTAGYAALAEDAPKDGFLPIGLTEEELTRMHEIGMNHITTAPPTGALRNCAEWEPSEGVIIRYPLGIPVSLVAAYSEDLMVTTIVASTYYQTQATSTYQSGGVNMDNVQFLIAPTNSHWTRDYGPWFIFRDREMSIVDHVYNRPRPLDDVIPQAIGTAWGMDVYGMDLIATGGNHMSDGLGMSMSTELTYNENPSLTEREVDSMINVYLGNDFTVLDYIESGGIHHIDCWAKMLSPSTIMVKDVSASSSSYALLNARANWLATQMSPWGMPYNVVRVYCQTGAAYTNSIIINHRVYMPTTGNSYYDGLATEAYEAAMPGYEVLGFTGSWYDDDAIHCRAMGVPDREMLAIDHNPLYGTVGGDGYSISVVITPCSDSALIPDSLKIFYRVDDGPWMSAPLSADEAPDSAEGLIPAQSPGSKVDYYLQVSDLSGRVETHPFIGGAGAHTFSVNASPMITSDDSIFCWSDSEFGFLPEFIDPDDVDHLINYPSHPGWLAVSGDSLVGTTPQARELTMFSVEVADQYSADTLDVTLFVCICGDINDDGIGPNIADLTYLVAYLFGGGQEPPLMAAADNSGDGNVNIVDLTYLVAYLFNSGEAPLCVQP